MNIVWGIVGAVALATIGWLLLFGGYVKGFHNGYNKGRKQAPRWTDLPADRRAWLNQLAWISQVAARGLVHPKGTRGHVCDYRNALQSIRDTVREWRDVMERQSSATPPSAPAATGPVPEDTAQGGHDAG